MRLERTESDSLKEEVGTYDRGELGRELVQMTEDLRQQPAELQRSAALRGLEPARHSNGE